MNKQNSSIQIPSKQYQTKISKLQSIYSVEEEQEDDNDPLNQMTESSKRPYNKLQIDKNLNKETFLKHEQRVVPKLQNVLNQDGRIMNYLTQLKDQCLEQQNDVLLTKYKIKKKHTVGEFDEVNIQNYKSILHKEYKERIDQLLKKKKKVVLSEQYQQRLDILKNVKENWVPVDFETENNIQQHIIAHKVRTRFKWHLTKSYFQIWKVTAIKRAEKQKQMISLKRQKSTFQNQKEDIEEDVQIEQLRVKQKYLNENMKEQKNGVEQGINSKNSIDNKNNLKKQQQQEDEDIIHIPQSEILQYVPFCNDIYTAKD